MDQEDSQDAPTEDEDDSQDVPTEEEVSQDVPTELDVPQDAPMEQGPTGSTDAAKQATKEKVCKQPNDFATRKL